MKFFHTKPATIVIAFLIFLFSNYTKAQTTIESTMDGGNWSDPATWTGGSVPTGIDFVILKGPVYLDENATCDGLTVQTGGELKNTGGARILDVTSDVINNGLIANVSYILTLNIHGNIENHGAWQNSITNFVGTFPQEIKTYATFEGTQLNNLKPSGNISTSIPLRMEATNFDLNNGILYFNSGLDTIYYNNGVILNGSIICQNSPSNLYCMTNAIHQFENISIDCDEVSLDGYVTFSDYFEIFGNTTVLGTLANAQTIGQSATINGNITNLGTIIDVTYGWSLYITGDIIQNGSWTVYNTYLSGNQNQHLYLNNPFEGENLKKNNPDGIIIAETKMNFMNTIIDFNFDSLMFMNPMDSLIMDGQFMQETIIINQQTNNSESLNIKTTGNAYFKDVYFIADEIHLWGNFKFTTPVTFIGNVVVNGSFENYTNIQEAIILGDLTNNGTIQDPVNICRLFITGNIYQNGAWINNQTYLNGTENQSINLINNQGISGKVYFDALDAGSPYQWYHEGGILNSPDFTGETSNILTWQVPVGSNWFGDFYCQTGAGQSRIITIEGGIRVDIKAFLEGPNNGSNMNDDLQTNGLIPLAQPYNSSPWNYLGTESLVEIPPNIVDWVLAEFRETPGSSATATPQTSIAKQALFLRNDGHLTNLDGSTEITVSVPDITENLYVVLWHRNHLPVLSAYPLLQSSGVYTYDFTISADKAFGNNQNPMNGGLYGMIAGDANADGSIDAFDNIDAWNPQSGETGYLPGDENLDGQVNNMDKNEVWLPNDGKSEILPE